MTGTNCTLRGVMGTSKGFTSEKNCKKVGNEKEFPPAGWSFDRSNIIFVPLFTIIQTSRNFLILCSSLNFEKIKEITKRST